MIKLMYSIYDEKAGAYLPPFYMNSAPQAIRAINDAMDDPQHQFSLHPEDYTLYELGTWNDNKCTFTIPDKSVVMTCLEIKALYEKNTTNVVQNYVDPLRKAFTADRKNHQEK